MVETVRIFSILGALCLLDLAFKAIGRQTRLSQVTLLLIFGFIIGPVLT
jgi:hypothetical protein